MKSLAERILEFVRSERYLIGLHASERLEERGILEWQVIDAMSSATFSHERPDNVPDPIVEYDLLLPDGTPVNAAWAYLRGPEVAKLVTVHYLTGA